MTNAIKIAGLGKTYRTPFRRKTVKAIDGIELQVEQGEAFGFVGPNGAGKSTTIKILTGLLEPDTGSASLFGKSVALPESRRGMGYVPENPYLYDYLTPYEILVMSMNMHQARRSDQKQHCMKWLERLDLAQVAHKTIRSFSKGMTQRVALAQAMCIEPKLLILDEPLSGLDPIGRRDVVEIFTEYKRAGGTLFFTSHVLHDVERLADHFGLIHQGRLRAVRSPAELAGADDLVVVRSVGGQPVEGLRQEFGHQWSAEVRRDALWGLLEKLRAAGHTIIEIRPTLSLESAFLRVVSENH